MLWTCQSFHRSHKRLYHPGACDICLIKAYFGLISNGANAKIKTKQQLLIYKFDKLTRKIRAPRYLIAKSLMIISSSILGFFGSVEFRSQCSQSLDPRFECSRHASQSSDVTVNMGARHVL